MNIQYIYIYVIKLYILSKYLMHFTNFSDIFQKFLWIISIDYAKIFFFHKWQKIGMVM